MSVLYEDGERNEDELKMIRKGKKGLTTTSSYKLDGICLVLYRIVWFWLILLIPLLLLILFNIGRRLNSM